MSNEELVMAIQAGDESQCAVLWDQVERLVAWKVNKVIRELKGYGGVEFDDLYNACYPAMLEAVKTYKPSSGAFSTWFMFFVKTAVSETTGHRTVKSRNDPLRNATSLAAPIGGEHDDITLSDIIPDPRGQLSLVSVEAEIMYKQIQHELAVALNEIPEDCREVITQRYYQQKSLAELGQEMGKTPDEIQNIEQKGIRALRQPKIAKRLRPLYDNFDFYGCIGLGSFRSCGMSVQERYVIRQENKLNK